MYPARHGALWLQRKTKFALSIAAFLAVALRGVLPQDRSRLVNPRRVPPGRWPYDTELGRVDGLPSLDR